MKGTGWCFLVCCASLGGCGSQQSNDSRTIASTGTEGPIEGRSTLGQALPIPGQPTVLVPFAIETQKGDHWMLSAASNVITIISR